jgi:beta-lactamase class A
MKENTNISKKIEEALKKISPKPFTISVSVINLKTPEPEISGYNMDEFIYPASIYKIFIAAEILRKIDLKILSLDQIVTISDPNEVDKNIKLFPKRNPYRPLLHAGDKVTIDYLLDLMLTRSDNTAANELMDIAGREDINQNIILPNGWTGSDVTRKFMNRLLEQKQYQKSSITVSTTRHISEFFYKVEKGELVNPWVSKMLKEYMLRWDKGGKTGLLIPEFKSYYTKGGWLQINGWSYNFFKSIINVVRKGYCVITWNNDAGVVMGEKSHYAIAVMTLTKSPFLWAKFPLAKLSKEIHDIMESH